MPMRYRVDEDLGIVITTAEGGVTGEDLQRHAQALAADPGVQGLDEMVDLSDRRHVDASAGAIRETARLLRERGLNKEGGKLALVAGSEAIFGMARLYAAHRDHPNIGIRVFRDRAEALEWLGVKPRERR